jgi:hypothetical protein
MKRVTGIGGILFKARDPVALPGCGLEFAKFGWVIDPDGDKVELWQPPPRQ